MVALIPWGESLAADIEMAHGKRRAARELEIALIGAFLREEIERCGFDVDLCETVDVSFSPRRCAGLGNS